MLSLMDTKWEKSNLLLAFLATQSSRSDTYTPLQNFHIRDQRRRTTTAPSQRRGHRKNLSKKKK